MPPKQVLTEFGYSKETAESEWSKFLEERLLLEQWEHEKTKRRLRSREIELERMRSTLYKERVNMLVAEQRKERERDVD